MVKSVFRRSSRTLAIVPLLAMLTGCQGTFAGQARLLTPENGLKPDPYPAAYNGPAGVAPLEGPALVAPASAVVTTDAVTGAATIPGNLTPPAIVANAADVVSNDGAGTLAKYEGINGTIKVDAAYILALGAAKLGEDGTLRILKAAGLTAEDVADRINSGTLGEILPAGGMEIAAKLLSTGEAVAVAHDLKGSPLMTTFSGDNGTFHLDLPPELVENVLVTAKVPGAVDSRLFYDLLTNLKGQSKNIDEESDILATYIKTAFSGRMDKSLAEPGALGGREAALAPQIASVLTLSVRNQIATKATEALMAVVPLDDARVEPFGAWRGDDEGAVVAITEVLAKLRTAAAVKMKEDPAFFTRAAYVLEANAGQLGADGFDFKRPSDIGDFLFKAYMSKGDVPWDKIRVVMTDLGVAPEQADRLSAAAAALSKVSQETLDSNPAARQKVMSAVGQVLGPAVLGAGLQIPPAFTNQ